MRPRSLRARRPIRRRFVHGNVDIFKNFTRGNALTSFGGKHEIVTFFSGVLASEAIDKADRLLQPACFDQETSAIRGPFTCHVIHRGLHPSRGRRMGLLISLETSAGCGLAKAENAIGQNAVCALELEMPGWGRLTRQQKSSTKCRECTRRAG